MLEAFWDEAQVAGVELPREEPVTAQAFSAARRKLPPQLLRALVTEAARTFDDVHGDAFRFRGRRLLAVDGARRFVRRSPELERRFGKVRGAHYPQTLVTTLFDVTAKVPIDVVLGRAEDCERREFARVLDSTAEGDVLVLDRGYPSFDVFVMLLEAGVDFVARMPASQTFAAVEKFVAGTAPEAVIELGPSTKSVLQGHPPISLRIVRYEHKGATPWILVTTLAPQDFSVADLGEAYHRRWQIEEFYKLLVAKYFGQGHLHATWAGGVEQEIYAQMLFVTIARTLMALAAKTADVPFEHLSQKAAILAVGDHITRLVLRSPPETALATLRRLLHRISRALQRPRPGRSSPRRSLLPNSRWIASGRRGGG